MISIGVWDFVNILGHDLTLQVFGHWDSLAKWHADTVYLFACFLPFCRPLYRLLLFHWFVGILQISPVCAWTTLRCFSKDESGKDDKGMGRPCRWILSIDNKYTMSLNVEVSWSIIRSSQDPHLCWSWIYRFHQISNELKGEATTSDLGEAEGQLCRGAAHISRASCDFKYFA